MTTLNNLPLFRFFNDLRASNEFPLGIDDYFVLVEALAGGFGVDTKTGLPTKATVLELCKTLWFKPNQSGWQFEQLFDAAFKSLENNNPIQKDERRDNSPNNPTLENSTGTKEKNNNKQNIDSSKPQPTNEMIYFQVSVGEANNEGTGVHKDDAKNEAKRLFLFSKDYYPLNTRYVAQICRKLPLKKQPQNTPNIDISATIQRFAQQGFITNFEYLKKQNTVSQIILLSDHQGSMVAFDTLRDLLKTALKDAFRISDPKDTTIRDYFFYNVPHDYLYLNEAHTEYEKTQRILEQCRQRESIVIVFSDAGSARGNNSSDRVTATIRHLFRLQAITSKVVWFNPMPKRRWQGTSAKRIARFVPMFETTEKGIQAAIQFLNGKITKP